MVTDVYAAREQPMEGVTSARGGGRQDAGADVAYVPALDDVPGALADLVHPGDLVLTLGAGDITTAGPRLVSLLEAARG